MEMAHYLYQLNQSGLGLGFALYCMCEIDRPQAERKTTF
jgi:hypothetical protein